MFTGIIECIGTIKAVRPAVGGLKLFIDLDRLATDSKIGDSIAVNGVCLTICKISSSIADFDISSETLKKTSLDRLKTGSFVNLESAMKAEDRFGGHIVQGHVDGTAVIRSIEKKGEFSELKFSCPAELLDEIVPKGSVAVNGISLTVADMNNSGFTVALIPVTIQNTTLGKAATGDIVNIETDVIIKTVKKQLEKILPERQGLTVDKLRELGF